MLFDVSRSQREAQKQAQQKAKLYESIDDPQADFNKWLVYYNTDRPHQGYRNMGRTPAETIQLMQETVNKER